MFYKPPVWAAAPNTLRLRGGNRQPPQKNDKDKDDPSTTTTPEWKLLQVKEGVVVATHTLSHQACTVLGRAADQVDIVLQHESCSRQHARIAFDGQTGTPWLLDLHSTHGTTVNRRPLPAAARHAEIYTTDDKTGSRGVILYPFDVLQFGASTRKFCLEGPADYERGTIKMNAKRPASVLGQRTKTEDDPKGKTEENNNHKPADPVLWGMDRMDDEPLDDSHPPFDWHSWLESMLSSPQTKEENQIPKQYQKEWDTIRSQWHKLEQAKLEHDRIQRKTGSGLSQGQEDQLQRLQQRQAQLQQTLESKAQKLYQSLYPAATKSRNSYHDYVDDEEVEDRTNRHRSRRNLASSTQPQHKDDAETEDSLVTKYTQLKTQLQQLQSQLQRWQRESASLKQQQQASRESKDDDEEAFFVQNQVQLVQQELDRARTQVQDTNQQLEETLKLLLIVAPQRHAQLLREQQQQQQQPRQTNVESSSNDSFSSHACPPPPPRVHENNKKNNNQLDSDGFVVPSAISKPTTRARSTPTTAAAPIATTVADQTLVLSAAAATATTTTTLPHPPPPKKPRIQLGPQAPPPPRRQDTRNGPHSGGTLEFVQAAFPTSTVQGSAAAPKSSRESSSLKTEDPRRLQSDTRISLQENDDTWRPPKDQDGSGHTKLNEKFAGRY